MAFAINQNLLHRTCNKERHQQTCGARIETRNCFFLFLPTLAHRPTDAAGLTHLQSILQSIPAAYSPDKDTKAEGRTLL